ncbi:hypothetical protein JR316_0001072 [Psilocybe cubensis]|uniref:Uncharacterized protein n=2 Tax=Psilocybe cubensis TaxID=181762 RepID=A0A8H7Y800_PSICU|nr:hypothetical protein JR316_0001072 [Psilocybe cubensis]KAH9487006.1 hypothetical protein JR316_0001072 [Psilocybe cubensis]
MFFVARWGSAVYLSAFLVPLVVNAFNFTNTNPTQCDDLTIQWTGGQPPFNLLVIPPGQILRNITIPPAAFANNAGTFTTQLALAEHQRVLFALSDATGVTAGGTSALFDVGASISGAQCNTTSPTADFFFSTDNDLFQCQPFPFSQYPNAVQPVTIIGFIPQSPPLIFHPPIGDSFSWNPVNLTAGTSIAFYMTDSQGRNGGIANIEVIRLSNDQSCLTTASSSGNPLPTGTLQPDSTRVPSSHTPLVAGVVAGAAALILVLAFALFCVRRRRNQGPTEKRSSRKPIDPVYEHAGSPAPEGASYLMIPTQYTVTPLSEAETMSARSRKRQMMLEDRAENQSFPSDTSRIQSMTQYPPSTPGPSSQFGTSGHSILSGYSSMVATSPDSDPRSQYKPSPRLIIHTDIAESSAEPLELPPQYSEGRMPIPGMVTSEEPDTTLSQNSSSRPGKNFRS